MVYKQHPSFQYFFLGVNLMFLTQDKRAVTITDCTESIQGFRNTQKNYFQIRKNKKAPKN